MSELSAGMVERVARALRADDGNPCVSSTRNLCRDANGCACRSLARAAIDAMREPTDEMLRVALAIEKPAIYREHLRHPFNGHHSALQTETEIAKERRRQWAVIDAALSATNDPRPPQPHDQPAADDASGMTKDQEIADLKRLLSLAKERLPTEKPRGPDTSGDGGEGQAIPPRSDWA